MKKLKIPEIPSSWKIFLSIAFVLGILLRVTFVEDMEYKEDEEYNFTQTQLIGTTQPWPWYGIPSGVYLVNPGMSIWVFAVLAKLFGIHQPTALATALQLFALLGMSLIIPFVLRFADDKDRKQWLWALALALVNPFLVFYQRKLWPEPFLPFFTMITLMGWWKRTTRMGAWFWGMIGAWLGQIHMSGFFFSAALLIWTIAFDRKRSTVSWKYWFMGSVVGALPLIPWFIYVLEHPLGRSMTTGWNEVVQLKYWTFWLTDSLGLHLGNPLGLLRGPSHWDQISDFVRYPIIGGVSTYLNGIAHLIAGICAFLIFSKGLHSLWMKRKQIASLTVGRESDTAFVQNSIFIGCGILLTATGVMIRRYYMAVTFPLEFIFLVRMAGPNTRWGFRLLSVLWVCELFISANFVGYIHANQGSVWGDYGKAYHLIMKEKLGQ